ncbi:MAG: hypothetical protein AAGA56_19835 [Myxococcota bacterium]
MSKRISAGSEIEAYCTKCKLDLDARVIAMDGDRVLKVECLTCRTPRNYRVPKSSEAGKSMSKKATKKKATKKKTMTKAAAAAAKAAEDLRQLWEQAIAGSSNEDFVQYRIDVDLQAGQLLRHKKFGEGVVIELIEGGKAEVVFESGPKRLVYGREL